MSAYGLQSYMATARQIALRDAVAQPLVLLRMLLAKAAFGLSATEYGTYGLQQRPWSRLRDYLTKKQTTALFARINPDAARIEVDDKLRFHRRCVALGLPVPTLHAVLCRMSDEAIADVPVLRGFADVLRRFADAAETRLILKPRRDSLGTGVRFVCLRDGTPFDIQDRPIDIDTFERELQRDMQRDDYLLQGFVRPHPTVAAWGSGKALGTLRIVTFVDRGQAHLLYALVRIPCGNNVHDNFSGGSSGNLIASVDTERGTLQRAFGRRDARFDHLLESFTTNPDTGLPLLGQAVPEWTTIRAAVLRAAVDFAELPLLGWDIALSADGVVVIEANANPDIIGAQVSCGRGARELLGRLYA